MKIKLIEQGLNVAPLLWALQENPQLWDQHRARTEHPNSPHYGLSDIWARWAAPGVDGSQPHESVWWPAADFLPVRELVFPLMGRLRGEKLGGVLITKIPAGKECKRHSDPGWHARHYEKFGVQIQSAPGQAFCFDGEALETRPGDVFWFDNAHPHWVPNPTPHDRITMIVCIRRERQEV